MNTYVHTHGALFYMFIWKRQIVQPAVKASANSLIDLLSARSSFMQTTFSLPEDSTTSFAAACALSISRQAMTILAPRANTERDE